MKTYEERLQEYAQLHADKWNINSGAWMRSPAEFKEEAEVTISAVADAIKIYTYGSVEEFDRMDEIAHEANGGEGSITHYLIENGYVPKPE